MALHGSVKKENTQSLHLAGLNHSLFTLVSFLGHETWHDKHTGVVVLPCLNSETACDWNGNANSIIILCTHVRGITDAEGIAVSIGLPRTPPERIHKATNDDITKAVLLLKHVVLASAYFLSNKEGPDTNKGRL